MRSQDDVITAALLWRGRFSKKHADPKQQTEKPLRNCRMEMYYARIIGLRLESRLIVNVWLWNHTRPRKTRGGPAWLVGSTFVPRTARRAAGLYADELFCLSDFGYRKVRNRRGDRVALLIISVVITKCRANSYTQLSGKPSRQRRCAQDPRKSKHIFG